MPISITDVSISASISHPQVNTGHSGQPSILQCIDFHFCLSRPEIWKKLNLEPMLFVHLLYQLYWFAMQKRQHLPMHAPGINDIFIALSLALLCLLDETHQLR